MLQNRCDVHTHTLFSRHAYSTVRENVLAAREVGMELLGTTDHFSDMLFPGAGLEHADMRDYQHFLNTAVWPRTWEGVRLLRGAEADLRTLDGRLYGQDIPVTEEITGAPVRKEATLYDRVAANCDYVIASVHLRDFARDATVAQTTEMYVRALSQPKVLVIGHAGRAGVPIDVREVVGEVARQHKLIEINSHSLAARRREGRTWQSCRAIAEACAELGRLGGARDARGDRLPAGAYRHALRRGVLGGDGGCGTRDASVLAGAHITRSSDFCTSPRPFSSREKNEVSRLPAYIRSAISASSGPLVQKSGFPPHSSHRAGGCA